MGRKMRREVIIFVLCLFVYVNTRTIPGKSQIGMLKMLLNGMKHNDQCVVAMKKWASGWHHEVPTFNDFAGSTFGRLIDSFGKVPSGVFKDHIYEWVGDRNECLGIKGAQHCLIPTKFLTLKKRKYGHFGICLPTACSKGDVSIIAANVMAVYLQSLFLLADARFPVLSIDTSGAGVV